MEGNEDSTKVTAIATNDLKQFYERIKRGQELHWHEWVKISKIKVGAKSRDDVADLLEFAKSMDGHPLFHQDIQNFIYGLFDISIEALKEYDQYKKQRGLIDYIDMEIQVKRLLDQKSVRNILKEELDLLMVDEFQDTNPIQLEIFNKLSAIAKHSVWVGDPKQSIYGFRGADPRLMQAIIEDAGGIKAENVQKHSWRSREDIVFATNALFTKAFPQLKKEHIALIPKRKKMADAESQNTENEPIGMNDALHHWHFEYDGEGKRLPGKPWMENCIAIGISRFIAQEQVIFSKSEKQYRKIQPGDIAVLCRSNAECAAMADALHRAGLKAAISRTGLLNSAEAKLILACLKFILNPKDSLSVAEIQLLASGKNIEAIIDDRLDFLERREKNGMEKPWAEGDEYINRLNQLRPEVAELSSAELLNLVMEELDLRRIILCWGKIAQRLDNVDVIRKFALQYEEACNRLQTAASLGGFLLWLNELAVAEQDKQGSGEGKDAVNVLTYHKSKGLEWPMVVCHSLEGRLRDRVWGVDIIPKSEKVDLNNLLGNRWLRYWVNPYAAQIKNTALEEKLNASEAKARATRQALEEEARLLYVGITRARDYLVFPTRKKDTLWLNRIWQEGNETHPTLDPNMEETPWEWEGKVLYAQTTIMPFPREFTYAEPTMETPEALEKPRGKVDIPQYFIDVDKEPIKKAFLVKGENLESYGRAIMIGPEADIYQVAKATKAFLTADDPASPAEERLQMARGFLDRYEIGEMTEGKELLRVSDDFFGTLHKDFSIQKMHRKYPVQLTHDQRLFSTIIDLILETDDGLVIIQNSSFTGKSQKQVLKKARDLRAWLHLSKMAVQQIFQKQKVRTYVHFVMDSRIAEVKTEQAKQMAIF